MLRINTFDKTIEITGNHPITKPFNDMKLELKFIEKVMDKSGIIFVIEKNRMLIHKANTKTEK